MSTYLFLGYLEGLGVPLAMVAQQLGSARDEVRDVVSLGLQVQVFVEQAALDAPIQSANVTLLFLRLLLLHQQLICS